MSIPEYALPVYLLTDVLELKQALDDISYSTDFMSLNLDVVPVFFEGEEFPVGEFRYQDGGYVFWISEKTLQEISSGYKS